MMAEFGMNLCKALAKGLASYVTVDKPWGRRLGWTNSARYCYSVWLRHLVMLNRSELPTYPKVVAELGPGDSLGTGFAAMLSGANQYYAFDVVKHTSVAANLQVFEELVDLFREQSNIPDETEFPRIRPLLDSYVFPSQILSDALLANALEPSRIEAIRRAIVRLDDDRSDIVHSQHDIVVSSFVPWHDPEVVKSESVDLVYSQAVMEHVEDDLAPVLWSGRKATTMKAGGKDDKQTSDIHQAVQAGSCCAGGSR